MQNSSISVIDYEYNELESDLGDIEFDELKDDDVILLIPLISCSLTGSSYNFLCTQS